MSILPHHFPVKNVKRPPSSGGFYSYPLASRSLNPLPHIASPIAEIDGTRENLNSREIRQHMMVFAPSEPTELLSDKLRTQVSESNSMPYHGFDPKESREVTLLRPLTSFNVRNLAVDTNAITTAGAAESPTFSSYDQYGSSPRSERTPALVSSFPPNDVMAIGSPSGRNTTIKSSCEVASTQTIPFFVKQKFDGIDEYTDWSSDKVDPMLHDLRLAILAFKPLDIAGFSMNWLQDRIKAAEQKEQKAALAAANASNKNRK